MTKRGASEEGTSTETIAELLLGADVGVVKGAVLAGITSGTAAESILCYSTLRRKKKSLAKRINRYRIRIYYENIWK